MTEPAEDGEPDLLAAEYVLGTLDPAERAYVERQAASDAGFAAMIEDWQARLAPLTLLVPPVAPPPDLWRRIERAVAPVVRPVRRRFWATVGFWQGAAAGGFAVAAALALFLALRPPVTPELVAALVPVGGGAPVFVATGSSDGGLRLQPVAPLSVAAGRDLELWALAAGAARPVSLGVLPAGGRRIAPSRLPAPRTQLLVSLEPAGGSPNGLPTGPVLYGGTLVHVE